jgi:hypothetical protein
MLIPFQAFSPPWYRPRLHLLSFSFCLKTCFHISYSASLVMSSFSFFWKSPHFPFTMKDNFSGYRIQNSQVFFQYFKDVAALSSCLHYFWQISCCYFSFSFSLAPLRFSFSHNFYLFILVVLEFALRASCLLGRCSTTYASVSSFSCWVFSR